MTPPHLHRSSGLLARSALVALVLAGCATSAASQQDTSTTALTRTAVLAGTDAVPSAIAAAAGPGVTVRHSRGSLDAQAQATRLAAEGFTTIHAIGAEARTAVAQAASAEVGDERTVWRTH
ncbi:hypothetical protein [Baekduia sp. Peel2402]|uniref:hypothetical protein n=1 Tax=Baekduia sp. Peel2402 TaxID=3458296 RepID=UPI00403EAC8D